MMNWRSFIQLVCWVILTFLLHGNHAVSQELGIGQWRTHLPYGSATEVVDAGDKVYCLADVTFFSYTKSDGSLTRYTKVNGLSDIQVSTLNYSPDNNMLLVAYANANIDLINDDGKVTNISAIKRDDLTGDKRIYGVSFHQDNAFLATGFGIVKLNVKDKEVKETYFIGSEGNPVKVNDVGVFDGQLLAATEEGIKTASLNASNLVDFRAWQLQTDSSENIPAQEVEHLAAFNNTAYATINDTLFEYNGQKWKQAYHDSTVTIENLSKSNQSLLVPRVYRDTSGSIKGGNILTIDPSGKIDSIVDAATFFPKDVTISDNGDVWIADFYGGLQRFDGTTTSNPQPNGPNTNNVYRITAENGQVWVAPGGVNSAWNYTYNFDGFFSFIDEEWSNYTRYNTPALDTMINIIDAAVRPSDNAVFTASYFEGLVQLKNGNITVHDPTNSSLQGYEPVPFRTRVSALAFDSENNLWVSNWGARKPVSVMKPDGSWQAMNDNVNIDGNALADIVVDDQDQVWFRIVRSSSQGLMVLNHRGTLDDQSDDVYRILSSGEGNGGLPTNNVQSLAKDKDGEIWVGTDEGIAVFYCPGQVLTNQGCDAERILVQQGQFNGFLLENERVNTIAVDDANRKWVGTNNGVWLFSEDGKEVIHNFTEDNSPLLSNFVLDIAVNSKSGEVFIGTDKGLISYKGEAVEGNEQHNDVYVYPNPVRENYNGKIAVKGLVDNAFVKITDMSGELVYEGRATGGQFVWDGNDYNGHEASPGVYLVYSSNDQKNETFVTKFVIME